MLNAYARPDARRLALQQHQLDPFIVHHLQLHAEVRAQQRREPDALHQRFAERVGRHDGVADHAAVQQRAQAAEQQAEAALRIRAEHMLQPLRGPRRLDGAVVLQRRRHVESAPATAARRPGTCRTPR